MMAMFRWSALGLLAAASVAEALFVQGNITAPCDSPIYCYGDLLGSISLAHPFIDSKTFADM
jgi:alpha,alpha-trehalase